MGIRDVVIKVRHQVVNHNLAMSMPIISIEMELLKDPIDPGTCSLTCLQGILARHPQVGRKVHSGNEPSQPIGTPRPARAALEDH